MTAGVGTHPSVASENARDTPIPAVINARAVFDRARTGAPHLPFYVPLVLVSVALALLAVLPVLEQHRIASRLDEIARVIDPARIAVGDLQVTLALELAGMRGYLLTGEERYAESHREARSDRTQAYARLRELGPSLDSAHAATILAVGALLQDADALLDRFFAGQLTRDGFMSHLASQQERFVTALTRTSQLHHDLRARAAAKRDEIYQLHERGSYFSLLGVLIALVAVGSVAKMTSRQRALTASEVASRHEAERATAEAERRRQESERIGASRAGLMRGFSHDVKNALGVADGYLLMLEQGVRTPLNAAQRSGIERARRALQTANQLIADLLDLARAEAGEMTLHARPIDLRQLVVGVVDDYRADADGRGLAFAVDLPDDFPRIESDADRVAQILSNLTSNALKYTPAGRVTVRMRARQDERGGSWATVDVADTGPGIPEAARRVIFDEFRRLDASSGRKGTGIGLAISGRLAAALGGRITVASEIGHGAVFTLWLPLSPTTRSQLSVAAAGTPGA